MIENWVFIVAGFIAALVIFLSIYAYFLSFKEERKVEESLSNFENLVNIINDLCWSYTNNVRNYEIKLSKKVYGIYASENDYTEYKKDELESFIKDGKRSFGNYICIKMENMRLKCEKVYCNVSMIFMGASEEKPIENIFSFDLEIRRESNYINISLIS